MMQHDFCVLSLLTFKVVLMTWRLAQMKVFCSLLCDEWRIRMLKIDIECSLKWKNRYWIWITHKGSFYVVNVSSRSCSLFHANKCIFSRKGLKAMAVFFFKTVTSVLSGILILLFLSLLLLTIFLLNLPNLNCTFFSGRWPFLYELTTLSQFSDVDGTIMFRFQKENTIFW